MPKKPDKAILQAWTLDQLAKSSFFQQKAQEWGLLKIAEAIEQIAGENLDWQALAISELAWNKVIHRGIKPVIVFAHPVVLKTILGSVGYYRMLALVSQKSMKRIGLNLDTYETSKPLMDNDIAYQTATHLNHLISTLIEADTMLDKRNFDLWRGMSAGTQAQGAWQNNKGAIAEATIKQLLLQRLQSKSIAIELQNNINLGDGRTLIFSDEPDIAIYANSIPLVAIEVKGGIDPAGILERVGATLKSLQRTYQENPQAITILIIQDVAMTVRAKEDLSFSAQTITHIFSIQALLESEIERLRLFEIMQI
ncbi:MAG: XcyI family restriction endonuclease [bacterium]|nr:XcyI family restriction endonuclease [bacterium]